MSDQRTKESELVTAGSMAVTDKVRILQSSASRNIVLSSLLDSSQTYLESIGFITSSTVGSGVANRLSVTMFGVDHIITLTEAVILADFTTGIDLTFTLPAMADAWDSSNLIGQQFIVKIAIPNSATKVTIATQGTDQIDNAVDLDLTGPSLVSATLVPDGTDWWIIGG